MRRELPSLRAIRAFESAARHGSFQKAAEELYVTPSAVSQQIRELESWLGIVLFERRARSVQLTDAGVAYGKEIGAALDRIGYATVQAKDIGDRTARLLILTTPSFGGSWLIRRLKQFQDRFPEYDVVLSSSSNDFNFHQDHVDVAVLYGGGNWTGLDVEFVVSPEYCAVCSPTLGVGLHSPDDLHRQKILRLIDSESDRWLIQAGIPIPEQGPRYSDSVLLLQAARDGQGVAIVQHLLVEDDIAEGTLIEPFDIRARSEAAYYLVTLPGGMVRSKIKAFAQWLKEEMLAGRSSDKIPPSGVGSVSYAQRLSAKFGRKPVVATSVVQFDNFTIQSWTDAMRRAADFHGIELIMLDGQNNPSLQAYQYDSFITQKVDLILVDPIDSKAIVSVVKKINEAGIPVINFDAPAAGGDFIAVVTMDWVMAGILSGVQIVAATRGKGNVVLIEGTPGFAAQFLRTQGVELVLSAYPEIRIVAKKTGMFSRAGGLSATEQLLREQQTIDVWYFQSDDMFLGGIQAIKAAGRRAGVKIISVDGNPEALRAMRVGDLDYEVIGGFNLQGWLVIETAAKVLIGEQVSKKVDVPLGWVPPLQQLDTAHAVAGH